MAADPAAAAGWPTTESVTAMVPLLPSQAVAVERLLLGVASCGLSREVKLTLATESLPTPGEEFGTAAGNSPGSANGAVWVAAS